MSLNRVIATASPQIASTAAVLGLLRAGPGCDLAPGAVVRTPAGSVELGAFSALLENGVMIGTSEHPVFVGQKVVFGHRCVVVGSAIGDLCEIGNASILLAGARVGRGCILGEGTLVPPETVIPDETVVVGRPGRVVRRINDKDRERIARLRSFDLSLPPYLLQPLSGSMPAGTLSASGFADGNCNPFALMLRPSAKITARSMAFCNSRTLPGQRYSCNRSRASSESSSPVFPNSRLNFSRK